jgi:hypothetical protein
MKLGLEHNQDKLLRIKEGEENFKGGKSKKESMV